MVSCGRPLQNQIVLPNYVDMRKSQSDLPKVRDKYYVHRPDKICRNHSDANPLGTILTVSCGNMKAVEPEKTYTLIFS